MANKFIEWITDSEAITAYTVSPETLATDTQRTSGFKANENASSSRVNSMLRQSSLVICALMNVVAPDNQTVSYRSAVADVQTLIENYLHNAANITTGVFNAARIPNLNASKITSGEFALARIPSIDVSRIPNLPASKITSGTFDSADRIPNLPASKITSGELGVDRIPGLPASKITSGELGVDRIPGLPASKITSGYISPSRIRNAELTVKGIVNFQNIIDVVYPVGSIFITTENKYPGEIVGGHGIFDYGTWVLWGSGRVPVCVKSNDIDFDAAEKTGGEKTHTLTIAEMPSHYHNIEECPVQEALMGGGTSIGLNPQTTMKKSTTIAGEGQAHNNMPPYITCYMWKRTA